VAKETQDNIHKTKGNGSVIDLTDNKVKSIKHYHYLKPEANVDASSHLKRKLDAIKELMTSLDCNDEDDLELYQANKRKCKEINIKIIEELEKQDAKILGNDNIITSSSNSVNDLSLDLSRINHVDADEDDADTAWV